MIVWPHTATVWHKKDGQWIVKMVPKACWQDVSASQLRKGAEVRDCTATVFLPAGTEIAPGDFVARGQVPGSAETAKDIQTLGARRVTAVENNDFGRLRHVEVTLA